MATDAHGTGPRMPVLSEAYKLLSRLLDRAEVRRIFFGNPEAVLEDREITVKGE